jgi:hypothetical protein
MSIPNLVSRYPLSVDRWVAPCQGTGQGRPAQRHAQGSTPRLARPTAPARPCPRAHASYAATEHAPAVWVGGAGRIGQWYASVEGYRRARGDAEGNGREHGSRRVGAVGTAHAPALARVLVRAHTPRMPVFLRAYAYMRVPVSHHARVSVCVCPRAPGEGGART